MRHEMLLGSGVCIVCGGEKTETIGRKIVLTTAQKSYFNAPLKRTVTARLCKVCAITG